MEPGSHTEAVAAVVRRLGHVPLPIAMAASYFRNADDDVAQLWISISRVLRPWMTRRRCPPASIGQHSPVRFAVNQIPAKTDVDHEFGRLTQLLIYHSAFFAPE